MCWVMKKSLTDTHRQQHPRLIYTMRGLLQLQVKRAALCKVDARISHGRSIHPSHGCVSFTPVSLRCRGGLLMQPWVCIAGQCACQYVRSHKPSILNHHLTHSPHGML